MTSVSSVIELKALDNQLNSGQSMESLSINSMVHLLLMAVMDATSFGIRIARAD